MVAQVSDCSVSNSKYNTKTMKVKHVAIIAQTAALAQAIQTVLEPTMRGFSFSHVTKINDRPAGSQIAALGLPSFLPNNEGVVVHSLGSSYDANATTESRAAQWEKLRNPESTCEDIVAELGGAATYHVIPGKVMSESKLALADIKLNLAEAEPINPESSVEEQLAATTARLALYKEGFEILAGLAG